ncbi:hypothetical protein [Roseomonas sp. SXEYE001]|uniref:hypothetical protein n=1 Tax=Roseomonas xinghualingensis TaxID=2986475 RepID=UPI0038D388B2
MERGCGTLGAALRSGHASVPEGTIWERRHGLTRWFGASAENQDEDRHTQANMGLMVNRFEGAAGRIAGVGMGRGGNTSGRPGIEGAVDKQGGGGGKTPGTTSGTPGGGGAAGTHPARAGAPD